MTAKETAEAQAADAKPTYPLLPIIGEIVRGMLVSWPIFDDTWPARVLAAPAPGFDDRGNPGTVVQLIVQRQTREGATITKIQKVLDQYVFARPEGLVGDLIDGRSEAEVLADHAQRFGEFMHARRTASTVAE